MKHEIFNLKCCDSFAPYNNYGEEIFTKIGDCLPRSVKVSQMIGSDINFGMVYFNNPIAAQRWKKPIGNWCAKYGWHLWTEKNGNLYESCRQWNLLNPGYELNIDECVMMFDISHYKIPKSESQMKILWKDIKKKLEFASSKGINYVYFCGLYISQLDKNGSFEWQDWDYTNGEIDLVDKRIEYFEEGREFILAEHE